MPIVLGYFPAQATWFVNINLNFANNTHMRGGQSVQWSFLSVVLPRQQHVIFCKTKMGAYVYMCETQREFSGHRFINVQQTLVPYQHHAHYTETASIFVLNKSFITCYYISSLFLQQQFMCKKDCCYHIWIVTKYLPEKRYIAWSSIFQPACLFWYPAPCAGGLWGGSTIRLV